MENRKKVLIAVLGMLGIILTTAGVTVAWFTYSRTGVKENTITSGSITFHYQEGTQGLSLQDAMPMTDTYGKAQDKYFDFTITSKTNNNTRVPYYITVRRSGSDDILDNAVKLYLAKVDGQNEAELVLSKYGSLNQYTHDEIDLSDYSEKLLYQGMVPAGTSRYEQKYRLRMWIADDINYTSDVQNKNFTVKVNVYSTGNLLNSTEAEQVNTVSISRVSLAGNALTESNGVYEAVLPFGTTSTTIDIETSSEYDNVTVVKTDSTYENVIAMNNSNIQRLTATKSKTLELNGGDNFFKIIASSENGKTIVTKRLYVKVMGGSYVNGLMPVALQGLAKMIYDDNTIIDQEFTYDELKAGDTTNHANTLYKSIRTNSGLPTYFFRGAASNNYVTFAGKTWRIVRINEDGTVRIVMQTGINDNTAYRWNPNNATYIYFEDANNLPKTALNDWYQTNIVDAGYAANVASGDYFCEKTASESALPTFNCENNGQGYGIVNTNIALLTFEEAAYAGGSWYKQNTQYYLYNNMSEGGWLMNPYNSSKVYRFYNGQIFWTADAEYSYILRPVINLKADVTATKDSNGYYVVD